MRGRRRGDATRRRLARRRRQVARAARARARPRRGLVALDQVADAVAVVDLRAAEAGGVDLLAERLAHDAGAGQEHRRVLGHHDQVGQRRRVGAAAGRRAGDDRDLRDHAGQRHRLAEDPAVAGQRRGALLHAGAAGLDEPDHGDPRPLGRLQHADDRVGVALAERAAEERAVLRVAGDRPAVDARRWRRRRRRRRPRARPAAATRRASAARWSVPGSHSASRRSSGISRSPDRSPRTCGRAHLAAPRSARATLWPPNANEFEIASGGWPLPVTSGRASPGT